MKPHRILKTFNGSQTGHDFHHFPEGEIHPLSDDLAKIAVQAGWAELHGESSQAEDRDTKVIAPDEFKTDAEPAKKIAKKAKG